MTDWFPEAIRVPGAMDLAYTGGGAKGLLHTTEGGTYSGALSVYKTKGYWPHATASYEHGRFEIWQHLPLAVAGKALEHVAGTPPTNTDNVVQIELVGSADRSYAAAHGLLWVGDFPHAYLDGIARWMRFVEQNHGVARRPLGSFVPGAPRLTAPAWHEGSGWCGHMHVPNNSHVDPGPIDIAYLLGGGPTPIPHVEDRDVRYTCCTDPETGGVWQLQLADGGVITERGAPFLGSLPAHPDWHAADAPNHAVQDITPWKDGAGRWGYTIWSFFTEDGQLHGYDFPRSGALAK